MTKWSLIFTLFLLPIQALLALGLGQIQVNSKLGEPLEAEIGFVSADGINFDTVDAGLADGEAFQRAGIQRVADLFNLQFTVSRAGAEPKLLVTTEAPVNEPFLN
ncbi:MAG TPA: peptidoglycan-binding protein LysM, partial [Gammaproteobacteria bacterium]|nr:peptidoglycan-binding protein LysM [Gammaproteobacteria bacterium]